MPIEDIRNGLQVFYVNDTIQKYRIEWSQHLEIIEGDGYLTDVIDSLNS